MDIQNTYTHGCHHIAHGPVLSNPLIYLPLTTHTRSLFPQQKLHLKLPFRCPFCENPDLHNTVPAGKGVLVIMSSLTKEDEKREMVERSFESKLLLSIPSIYSALYPPYLSTFYSGFYPPPPPLSYLPPNFPLSPPPYYSPSPKVPNSWKIIRICGVEDIKSAEWAYKTETEIIDDKTAIEHPENIWSERRQNFAPREEEWMPMAWIPRPVGDVDLSTIPDTGPHSIFHSFTNSRFPPQYSSSSFSPSHSNLNPQNRNLHISQSWRGATGEDSNGYGYRGRILGQSRLPGMMSELGAFLRNERAEDGNWGSRTDMRERMRERGVRLE